MRDTAAIRDKLAKADRLRAISNAAEAARSKIRLSQEPAARNGWLGFRKRPAGHEVFFTAEETAAIYCALAKVRDEHRDSADQIEREVAG